MLTDLRLALRGFRRAPTFSLITIATLALGIGGTGAVLALINAVLLQALPFTQPERLAFVRGEMRREGIQSGFPLSYLDVESMAAEAASPRPGSTLADVAAVTGARPFNLTAGTDVEHVAGEMTTVPYLRLLGVSMAAGRWFSADEGAPPGARVVVLSYDLWQRRFGGNATAIGSTLLLNEQPYVIIGVAAQGFAGISDAAQLWLPLGLAGGMYGGHYIENREFRWLSGVVRVRPTATGPLLDAGLESLSRRLESSFPKENAKFSFKAVPMTEAYFGGLRRPLYTLFGGAALVLLIACSNVANLMLVRATARQRDTALRIALGAGRYRLGRAVVIEMMVIGAAASIIGIAIAIGASRLLVASGAISLASFVNVRVDPLVILATATLSVGCAVLFGALPPLLASRVAPGSVLGEGSRGSAGGRNRQRLQRMLVGAQVAVAIMLLVGAGLITRGFSGFLRTDLGFRADSLLSLRVDLVAERYRDNAPYFAFARALLEQARQVPGVSAAALEGPGFPTGGWYQLHVRPTGAPTTATIATKRHHVSPGYFATMGMRQVEGRDFSADDVPGPTHRSVVISQALARRAFPDAPALGKTFVLDGPTPITLTVIGIVEDVKHGGLQVDAPAQPDIYLSVFQSPARSPAVLTLFVRSASSTTALASALESRLKGIDPNVAFYDVQFMRQRLAGQTTTGRFLMVLMVTFGIIGLTLAAIGVYGVISYGVAQRTREIGVHIALGAATGRIIRSVVIDAMIPVGIGAAAGLVGVAALHKSVSALLYGMSPADPSTILVSLLVVGLAAVTASSIPARRAARIDPAIALRAD